jgi:hypothetical protein
MWAEGRNHNFHWLIWADERCNYFSSAQRRPMEQWISKTAQRASLFLLHRPRAKRLCVWPPLSSTTIAKSLHAPPPTRPQHPLPIPDASSLHRSALVPRERGRLRACLAPPLMTDVGTGDPPSASPTPSRQWVAPSRSYPDSCSVTVSSTCIGIIPHVSLLHPTFVHGDLQKLSPSFLWGTTEPAYDTN